MINDVLSVVHRRIDFAQAKQMRKDFYDMSQAAQLKYLIGELSWMSQNGKIVYQLTHNYGVVYGSRKQYAFTPVYVQNVYDNFVTTLRVHM